MFFFRREISLNGLMTQSLINLPRSRDGGEVMPLEAVSTTTATMTMSMHAVLTDSSKFHLFIPRLFLLFQAKLVYHKINFF